MANPNKKQVEQITDMEVDFTCFLLGLAISFHSFIVKLWV